MADNAFSGIDQLLGESVKRLAEPGDPAGVAELIRARVAGGDTGTPSKGGEFSGGPGSGWPWLPWGGVVVVTIIAAFIAGVVGANGGFDSSPLSRSAPSVTAQGPVADPVSSVEPEEFVAEPSPELPTPASPEPEPPAPKPVPPQPVPPQPPPAPVDNPPALGTVTASDAHIYSGESTTITTSATDDHGVNSVEISWTGQHSGSGQMQLIGGQWRFTYTATLNPSGTVTFTVRAVDGAGQLSEPRSVNVTVEYFG